MPHPSLEEHLLELLLDHYQTHNPELVAGVKRGLSAGLTPLQIEEAARQHCPATSAVAHHVRLLADHFHNQRQALIGSYARAHIN